MALPLPTDVVDLILGFFQADLVTLKTCAQSHPTLSKLSERHIYAKITLHDDLDSDKIDPLAGSLRTTEFTQILDKSPGIANHVRSLKIYVNNKEEPKQLDEATVSHLNSVASILPTFLGLTKIAIEGTPRSRTILSWHTLPETFRQVFLNILHVQDMKEVSISSMAFFPLSLLDNCKNRNVKVTLDMCQETRFDRKSKERGSFEHLSVENYSGTHVEGIMAWIQTHGLRSLKFGALYRQVWQYHHLLPPLLAACSSTLTNLDVGIEDEHFQTPHVISVSGVENQNAITSSSFPFTLDGLFHLEQLTICALPELWCSNGPCWNHCSPIPAITELISNPPPSLKRVFLNFDIHSAVELSDSLVTYIWSDVIWSPFIPLAAKCSSLSITVYASIRLAGTLHRYLVSPDILSSPVGCPGLMPYVEKGVFITMPRVDP